MIAPLNGGEERVLTQLDHPQGPAWSPLGKDVAFFTGSGDLYIVGVDGGQPRQVTSSGNTCSDLYPSRSQDASMLPLRETVRDQGRAAYSRCGATAPG